MRASLPVVMAAASLTASHPSWARSPEKQCAALKPVQQLETERERQVDVFLQAAAPGYGRGKVKVDVDSQRSWEVSLLQGDELARAFYGYQLCILRANGMLEQEDHRTLLQAAYGSGNGSARSTPSGTDPTPPGDASAVASTPPPQLEDPNPTPTPSEDSVVSDAAPLPVDSPDRACPVQADDHIELRSPVNLFSFDIGDSRYKLLNAKGSDEVLQLLEDCGAYEAAAALQTFRTDRAAFGWKASAQAYARMHIQYDQIVNDLATVTQASCSLQVRKEAVPCRDAMRTVAPKIFE